MFFVVRDEDMCDGGSLSTVHGCQACFDPRWAQWIVPNCAVDVAKGAPHPTHYTDLGDGLVLDDVTHLMWQRTIDGANASPPPAIQLAEGARVLRLLAVGEVRRLAIALCRRAAVDRRLRTFHPIDRSTVFPNTPAGTFWTSTAMVNPAGWAWIVIFDDARTTQTRSSEETYSYVRCVR